MHHPRPRISTSWPELSLPDPELSLFRPNWHFLTPNLTSDDARMTPIWRKKWQFDEKLIKIGCFQMTFLAKKPQTNPRSRHFPNRESGHHPRNDQIGHPDTLNWPPEDDKLTSWDDKLTHFWQNRASFDEIGHFWAAVTLWKCHSRVSKTSLLGI